MSFRKTTPQQLTLAPFVALDKQWALLSAGTPAKSNAMTVSWGLLGTLWNLPVTAVFARPQRYTKEFLDREDTYALSFFGEAYRKTLTYYGAHSGRDGDKAAQTGLTVVFDDAAGCPYFAEAERVLLCRKRYVDTLKESSFLAPPIVDANYPARDFHTFYIGEVLAVLEKE